MSIHVTCQGTQAFGAVEFDRDTMHTMSESPAQTAEKFAQALEDIAATLRRMYPLA